MACLQELWSCGLERHFGDHRTLNKVTSQLQGAIQFPDVMVNLRWTPRAHQASPSVPSSADHGGENKMKKPLWAKIKAL